MEDVSDISTMGTSRDALEMEYYRGIDFLFDPLFLIFDLIIIGQVQ